MISWGQKKPIQWKIVFALALSFSLFSVDTAIAINYCRSATKQNKVDFVDLNTFTAPNFKTAVDPYLIRNYISQPFSTVCGFTSVAIILNSMTHSEISRHRYHVEDTIGLIGPREVQMRLAMRGLTLRQMADYLVYAFNFQPKIVRIKNMIDLKNVRLQLQNTLNTPLQFAMVNFNGKDLNLGTRGHFSPIAAYDPISDSVLVLDVAAHKNKPFWVKLEVLAEATKGIDSESNEQRGFLFIDARARPN